MRILVRIVPAALVLAALLAAPSVAAAQMTPMGKPAIEMNAKGLGKVVATPAKLGIYYWDTEKMAKGKIRCTGQCAVEWPPVFVKGMVAKHVKGVMATFGTVKRGKKLQLTVNGLPAYTYRGDTAGIVKCDGVNGWHAVRPM